MNSAYQSQDITELAKALLNVQLQLQPTLKDAEEFLQHPGMSV